MGDYAGPISGSGPAAVAAAPVNLGHSSGGGGQKPPGQAGASSSYGQYSQPAYPNQTYGNQSGYQVDSQQSGAGFGMNGAYGASSARDQSFHQASQQQQQQLASSSAYDGSNGYAANNAASELRDPYARQAQQDPVQAYNEKMSYPQQQQQQQQTQHQQYYHDTTPQQQQSLQAHRMASDNYGIPSAGPPSPGKMDMLPHGTGPNHPPYSATQKNKGRAVETYEPVTSHHSRTTSKGSSTTSEFTKRKNWSQRIVEEMRDVLHVLSPSGTFLFASPSINELTGFSPEELVGRRITDFMERDDIDSFLRDFAASIHNDTALTTYFRFRGKDNKPVLFEVTGQPYYTISHSPNPSPSPSADGEPAYMQVDSKKSSNSSNAGGTKTCKSFFAMARSYPSKDNAMLDSFLELKIENEKLREKLSEIYKEIEGEPDGTQLPPGQSEMDFSNTGANTSGQAGSASNEARPISGFPHRMSITQQGGFDGSNMQGNASQQQDQQGQANSTYYNYATGRQEDAAGQQQQQGQRPQLPQQPSQQGQQGSGAYDQQQSRGTAIDQNNVLVSSSGLIPSTSNTYGALGIGISSSHARQQQQHGNSNLSSANGNSSHSSMQNQAHMGGQGDLSMDGTGGNSAAAQAAAAAAAASLEEKNKKKMKKQRLDEGEFVCRDCGTVDSPEWRRGPLGPKTLCNACGLRWAKKNKQATRQSGGGPGDIPNASIGQS